MFHGSKSPPKYSKYGNKALLQRAQHAIETTAKLLGNKIGGKESKLRKHQRQYLASGTNSHQGWTGAQTYKNNSHRGSSADRHIAAVALRAVENQNLPLERDHQVYQFGLNSGPGLPATAENPYGLGAGGRLNTLLNTIPLSGNSQVQNPGTQAYLRKLEVAEHYMKTSLTNETSASIKLMCYDYEVRRDIFPQRLTTAGYTTPVGWGGSQFSDAVMTPLLIQAIADETGISPNTTTPAVVPATQDVSLTPFHSLVGTYVKIEKTQVVHFAPGETYVHYLKRGKYHVSQEDLTNGGNAVSVAYPRGYKNTFFVAIGAPAVPSGTTGAIGTSTVTTSAVAIAAVCEYTCIWRFQPYTNKWMTYLTNMQTPAAAAGINPTTGASTTEAEL